ncbi:histidine kinase dimerization/phosphoacceptor domain -containing protein [Gracilimonas mengyeensis]|uniref:histidine kinase dimerization/phosphoacceptor domain -containing protein n=1 Tax=Gracilimonas mengyeensis TaxID=1302730 RepID=UPI00163D57AC|nr:histidine kinase dimerization/phosphoacceptor domain -containing protein [Gracilimonas mengyeensis]
MYKKYIGLCLAVITVNVSCTSSVLSQVEQDSIWTFSEVRMDADGDNDLDYYGREVTVTGIANTATGLLHEYYLQVFIQNDSAGMSIFAYQINTPFEVGDSLVVKGKIERYNGLTEVHANSYKVYKDVGREPEPKSLKDAAKNPASHLGMLIEGEGCIIEKGNTFNGKYLRIKPADAEESIMVYVSNFHRLYEDFNFSVLSVGDEIDIKGVVSESNPDFPEERIFKVFLRTPEDLQYAGLPQFYLYLVVGGAVLLGLIIAGWVIMLRRRVTTETTEIRTSLKEKEVLLREIHHRVKNSLSTVSGLIELQLHETDSEEAKGVLQNSKSRIQSVALIHDKLYKTESLARVELDVYLRDLVETIHETFTEYHEAVELTFDLDPIELDTDRAIPCGLLVNELVVNAYKHAFKRDKQGVLSIRLKVRRNKILLEVSDNGPGLPDTYYKRDGGSLGTLLVDSFTEKLEAKMDINKEGEGTTLSFTFPLKPRRF